MRKRIWHADDYFPNMGKRLDMDSQVVTLPTERVPLTWNFNHERQYGWVINIQREGDEIWGDLELHDPKDEEGLTELFENNDVRLGGFYKDVDQNPEGTQVLNCSLASVSVVLNPLYGANPGASI